MPYLRNKRTGETVFVPDQPQMPANPEFPYKGPQAQATLGKTQAEIDAINARTNALNRSTDINERKIGRETLQAPISKEDQAFINNMRGQQGDLPAVLRDITAAQKAVDRFQPAPGRGTLYGAGTVDDTDGIFAAASKAPLSLALPDETQRDYQTLKRLQNAAVLNKQIEQKGPQTESDAARMALTAVDPNKNVGPNAQLLAEQQYDVIMKTRRPAFYENWANKLGSTHALNRQGKSADQIWQDEYEKGLRRMRSDPRYKRAVYGSPNGGASSNDAFLGWED